MAFSASCARRLRLRDFEWRLLGFGMTYLQNKVASWFGGIRWDL